MPDYANEWAKLWNLIWANASEAIDEVLNDVYQLGYKDGQEAPKEVKEEVTSETEESKPKQNNGTRGKGHRSVRPRAVRNVQGEHQGSGTDNADNLHGNQA